MAIGFRQHLRQQLHKAAADAARPFVSWTEPWEGLDPLSFFLLGPSCGFRERFFWSDRSGSTIFAGLGVAYAIETEKMGDRFDDMEAGRRRWEGMTEPCGAADGPPILFGGFSFDPHRPRAEWWRGFPAGKLVAPAALLAVRNGRTTLTVTVPTDQKGRDWERIGRLLDRLDGSMSVSKRLPPLMANEEEEKERWLAAVREAIAAIRARELDKVVLARARRLTFAEAVDAAAVLGRLREQQPFSYLFAFEQDGRCFLGASPEQLVQKEGETCRSVCLAGSVRRGGGLEEDERLGAWLQQDRKNREEHQFVVQMIGRLFASVCDTVEMPPAPQLLKLPHIQHLCTPVIGHGCRERSVLRLVELMHPTPALGGTPRDRALEAIGALEPLDRGWYAAPIGWVDGEGNGEWAVAIRSALLVGKEAVLFAGCGIVADSHPDSEYEETNVKMIPMLSALGVMNDG
ncbi:isochorismate synthase [Geobacillus vulcani]|uniref:isochorismate synthase n=1 Tax=Geobacillus vulcani TaxID=135517 RepID=UPI0004DEDC91|nr:isochorismate synthase [Geobacillus vulcani]